MTLKFYSEINTQEKLSKVITKDIARIETVTKTIQIPINRRMDKTDYHTMEYYTIDKRCTASKFKNMNLTNIILSEKQ